MPDPHVRVVGLIDVDDSRGQIAVGIDYDAVTITFEQPGFRKHARRLESVQAAEFVQLFLAACWEAARQGGLLAAQCPADCGAQHHDQACRTQAPDTKEST